MKKEDIFSGIRNVFNGDIVVFTCRLWFSPAEGFPAYSMWLRLSPTYVPVLNMFGVRTGAGWHREKGSIKMVKAVTLSQDA